MISVKKVSGRMYVDSTNYMEGKSTDVKPTEYLPRPYHDTKVGNCDTFYCIDTQQVFKFDSETKTWLEQ